MKKYFVKTPARIKYLSSYDSFNGGATSNFVFITTVNFGGLVLEINFPKPSRDVDACGTGYLCLKEIESESERGAYLFACDYFSAACFALSYFAQRQNLNQHYGHMQVVWDAAKTEVQPRDQFISIGLSMTTTTFIEAPPEDVKNVVELALKGQIPDLLTSSFLHSLSDSDFRSKFYHAFSVVEFLENNYTPRIQTSVLLKSEQVETIEMSLMSEIGKYNFSTDSNLRIKNAVKNSLVKLTKENRAEKLFKILNEIFGIHQIKYVGQGYKIDQAFCKAIIELRNGLFHGKAVSGSFQQVDSSFKRYTDLLILLNQDILNGFIKGHGNLILAHKDRDEFI